jgi:hypothetical protein
LAPIENFDLSPRTFLLMPPLERLYQGERQAATFGEELQN